MSLNNATRGNRHCGFATLKKKPGLSQKAKCFLKKLRPGAIKSDS